MTGRGADVLIVDDPIRDVAEAESPAVRDAIWEWFQGVALTRMSPSGAMIVIQTRWHIDDLTGRLLDESRLKQLEESGVPVEPWHVLNLPAIAEENDQMGRLPGEALWPERWTVDHLRGLKAEMMTFLWNALYRGDPEISGGNYVDVRNLKLISRSELPVNLRFSRFWDLATSEKKANDFTGGAAVAILPSGKVAIADVHNEKLAWPESRDLIGMIGTAEGFPIGIEAVAGFKTSVQNVREKFPELYVKGIDVANDKLTRALPWLASSSPDRGSRPS